MRQASQRVPEEVRLKEEEVSSLMEEIHKMTGVIRSKEEYRKNKKGEQPGSTEECQLSQEECTVRILKSIKKKED